MSKEQQIVMAKQILREAGFYADVLWHIDDIQTSFKCGDNEAMGILYNVLESPEVTERIFAMLRTECIKLDFPKCD